MNVIGFSGLANSIPFKRKEFPGLTEREYNIVQGLDAAVALLGDKGIIAAAAEERFTRLKATGAFPLNAFKYCLAAGNLQPADVDVVAHGFSYESHKALFQGDDYAKRQYAEVFSPEVQRRLLKEHFGSGRWDEKFVAIPHHLAHAVSAFYPSGFEEALILVSDGMGEMESMTVAVGQGKDIRVLTHVPAFHSLGALYGVFSLYLGFFMNSDEYKVMGLAPYGNSRRYFDKLMEFVSLKEDGTYTLPIFAHNQTLEERETHRGVLRFLVEQFGPSREAESEITQAHKDLAASLQAMLQTIQLHVLRHFKRETGLKNLCMAGGVALNCSANGVIKRSELFKKVFVEPASGDDGSALGAALYASRLHDTNFKPKRMGVPLWGPQFSEAEILKAAEQRTDCDVIELDSFGEVCNEVTDRLKRGEIIAWFQDRMEFGPRALGSRSILADPRDPTMRDKINALVKKREGFRPFAPVVKREAAAEIFEIPPGDEEAFAHMLFVTHVRPEYRDKLPATTHVDGSARVQTVAQQDNPKLWQLLNTFAETTGMPVLLNTSFNVRGQPIVCTPEEAIDTFLKARLDALVLGNLILLPRKHEVIDPAKTEEHRKQLEEAASRHEEFWVNRLSGLEPVSVPLKRKELTGANVENPAPIKFSLSKEHLKNFGEETNPEVLWLAALSVWLARTTGMQSFDLSFTDANLHEKTRGLESIFATAVPLHLDINLKGTFAEMLSDLREELGKIRARRTYALDLPLRHPALKSSSGVSLKLPVGVRIGRNGDVSQRLDSTEITLLLGDSSETASLAYDSNLLDEETVSNLGQKLATLLQNLSANPESPLTQVSLLSEAERNRVLFEWNNTKRADVPHVCMHDVFAEQVKKTPNAIALAFREQELTYAELDRRATMVAAHLKTLGVRPDTMVAVCTEVCIEMMVGLLGVLKAGGAYVPLDPHYPADRIAFMLEDSQAPVLLTQKALVDKLPATGAKVVCLEDFNFDAATNGAETKLPATEQDPSSLAYVIYTSGSTGKPKGVMITHANVVNFFTGMDERVGVDPVGVWLAVTSISFDISVLELFWTLVRGFKVVLQSRETRPSGSVATTRARKDKPMDFSLFYFASDESASGAEKYRLLLEGAKFADEHGFAAVWTPERHFHAFGGLYPNPSVTSAAVAAITSKVQIRAGSVVLPLHNPIRVAEEWSVVDNISNGRVGISFASGWQVNDFALAPEKFSRRKEAMLEGIEQLRKMWRGETFEYRTPKGDATQLKVLPRPVQRELPIWLTASGNPDTFKQAGQIGANVLTHLLGQSLDELKQKISVYRAARKEAGHEGPGMVTLMLHTFVGESLESVKETVRKPFTNYLRSSIDLIKNDPWAFSTFKPAPKTNGNSHLNGNGNGAATWNDEERDAMAAHAFNRYFETSGLFGTPERCVEMVNKLQGLGVDEVACLIDFGVSEDKVLASLHKLNKVRESTMDTNAAPEPAQYSIPAQMVRHGVTHLQCTPSMASMLLEDPDATVALGSLKKLLLGGEALPLALIQHLDTKAEILNMYGPTETTIWSATDVVNKAENKVTIGRPIANTEIYIVDKSMQPTPAGIPGELLIGGAGVVRGYLHRPELTAEKFIPNTFNPAPGARLYRTGDLARHLPDGRVEFLGRLDHQVKLRGFRIELGEIETVISRHPSIKECVAIVREDVPGDKRLVAYVLPASAMGIEASALRDHSRESLPEYMVPSAFVPLTAFPLTPNGKVDRKALPAPSFKKAARAAAPTGSLTEQKVAEVYRELLGVEVSSFQDNFFELGGNSLLATQLITRLREAFKWQLPLRLAFEHPTVESLAAAISTGNQDSPDTAHAPETIEVAERNGPLPLSFAQQRIWFLHQLEPGSHYNDHFDLRLTGPVNTTVLERAINEIVRRHDALRSIFLKGEVGPVLQILPEVRLSMKLTDLSGLPFETREKEAIKLAVHDCQQPFDLETGPLLRAGLVKLHDTDHLLVLTFDHIVIDGWSHGVFLTELTAIYEAFLAGKPSPLPPLAVQYTDYAGWQQDWFQGKNIEPHLAYWRQQLANAPALLELPTDHPRPIEESFSGARHFLELEKPLVDGLAAVGRKENCTLFMVFLAAFQTLLAKYTEREDIIIGSPIANRNRAETEALIGSFMNTVVLRTNLSGDPEFKQLLHRVRKMSLDSYAHQDLPFEQLVADLQPTRNLGYSPVFQVMFILQNTPMPRANVGKLSFQHFDVDAGTSKLDITINLEETKDGAVGWIEYATDLFEAESIKNMAAHFKELLQNIVAAPQERLSKLRLAPKGAEWRFPAGLGNSSRRLSDRTEDPGKVQSTASASNSLGIPTLDLKPAVTASLTPVQKDLAAIWSDVLGIQDVAVDDNLFDLGGHSLLITRIISRIRKTFSVEIPIHTFFETPTLGGIATAIEAEQAKGTSQKAAEPRIQKLARR